MTNKLVLFFLMACAVTIKALTIHSVANSDWENPNTWSNQQVPNNPDTIFVSHYITFNQALTIPAPTVLVVDSGGTLCGNYQFNVSCGAKLYNYGRVWVNSAQMMDAWNYFEFYARSSITISACSLPGFNAGYHNIPPNGHTAVWPPVLCRTPGTYWDGGPVSAVNELTKTSIRIFPNPLSSRLLQVDVPGPAIIQLTDLMGQGLGHWTIMRQTGLDLGRYQNGLYMLKVEIAGQVYSVRLIKTD